MYSFLHTLLADHLNGNSGSLQAGFHALQLMHCRLAWLPWAVGPGHDGSKISLAGAAKSIIFVVTKHSFCRDRSMLVIMAKVLSWQAYFCHDKTCLLSWQKYACHDKTVVMTNTCFVSTNICQDKSFVVTKLFCHDIHNFVVTKVLSRQTCDCHDKTFVATKVILVATPINDSKTGWWWAS